MKRKLRELRKKKDLAKHYKGGFSISVKEKGLTSVFKRKGAYVKLKTDYMGKYRNVNRLKHYLSLVLKPKSKKRAGKNVI
ncbi:hypothetical protein [Fusobacterium polymorphum]|jgi:hypothetical protein|uniref:hypothetical protein n=1 Tax=Fusobacterium nucleatum subsp. polymorphum TaxID=76857 RepID=UPI0030D26C4E